jgi:hypothetical protein
MILVTQTLPEEFDYLNNSGMEYAFIKRLQDLFLQPSENLLELILYFDQIFYDMTVLHQTMAFNSI